MKQRRTQNFVKVRILLRVGLLLTHIFKRIVQYEPKQLRFQIMLRSRCIFSPKGGAVMRICLVVCLLFVIGTTAEKGCFVTPCKLYGKQTTCFQVGCKRAGLSTECHINTVSNTLPIGKHPECISAHKVPGFLEFCEEMFLNASSNGEPPHHISERSTTLSSASTPTTERVEESKLVKDENCFGTTILISVAIGSYLIGSVLTWMLICCCKHSPCCKKHNKNDTMLLPQCENSRRNQSTIRREIGSTSSAQLLPNASMETHSAPLTNDRRNNSLLINSQQQATPDMSSSSRIAQWASESQRSYPGSNMSWMENDRPTYLHARSTITQWPDGVYAPISEVSSRDYQSILGGSENHYVPASESSSDYSGMPSHKVLIIRDGEIYQASSESSGNDYTSLKGQRFGSNRVNDSVYYPTSECSYKDYATLGTEADENANVRTDSIKENKTTTDKSAAAVKDQVTDSNCRTTVFNVSGLDLPNPSRTRSWRKKELQDINEYEIVEDEEFTRSGSIATIADLCSANRESLEITTPPPHEYFKLDPM